jgi:hypothetical protein
MMKLTALLIALMVAGCATKPTVTAEDTIRAGSMDGAIKAAQTPLFELTCPALGCVIGSLKVGNPSAGQQLADVVKVAFAPQMSEAGQNFRAVLGVLGQVGGYAVIGHAASAITGKIVGGYTAGFDSNVKIAQNIPQPGAVSNTTNVLSGTGVLGSGTYTAPITTNTTTTTTTDRHDVITNPAARVCTPTFSATGTPTGFVCTGG